MDEEQSEKDVPIGGFVFAETPIRFNEKRRQTLITVRNTGDRPIQVGSHFHFFEVNKALQFDRLEAYGKRLNITSSTAIRFEPGDEVKVSLIPIGGRKTISGFNNLVDAWTGENKAALRTEEAIKLGYKNMNEPRKKA
ncbi:urease subunit beta [Acetobacteraceae bacterium]|nr:urease subunit beta [Acetobacteraceae bacterium]